MLTIRGSLSKNSTHNISRSFCFYYNIVYQIKITKVKSFHKTKSQVKKSSFSFSSQKVTIIGSFKRCFSANNIDYFKYWDKWNINSTKTLDEVSLEVNKYWKISISHIHFGFNNNLIVSIFFRLFSLFKMLLQISKSKALADESGISLT